MIGSGLDSVLAFIIIFFSAFGLIRGFLKEISSLLIWFGSFYLTSTLKPYLLPFFADKIKIPFLLDTIINVASFAILITVLSIISNYLTIILKKIIPSNIDGTLGIIIGFVKGFLISALIIAFIKILYDKSNNKPLWINNSKVYNSISYNDNMFVGMLYNIFGDYGKEKIIKKQSLLQEIETVNKLMNNNNGKENKDDINSFIDSFEEKKENNSVKDNLNDNSNSQKLDNNQKQLERLIDIINY